LLRAADLVSLIQDSIAINIPMAETGRTLPMEFSPRGWCIVGEPTKGPHGDLGHRNIMHTVRYTQLAPDRFRALWRD
jgi:hypothetical protein